MAQILGGRVVFSEERKGQWVAVIDGRCPEHECESRYCDSRVSRTQNLNYGVFATASTLVRSSRINFTSGALRPSLIRSCHKGALSVPSDGVINGKHILGIAAICVGDGTERGLGSVRSSVDANAVSRFGGATLAHENDQICSSCARRRANSVPSREWRPGHRLRLAGQRAVRVNRQDCH